MVDKTKIDLACGHGKKEGYFGIDIAPLKEVDLVHDLRKYPWPIESESVEKIHCSHYIEHIPHSDIDVLLEESNSFEEFKEKVKKDKVDGLIKFFNELYRIMKPGAKATIAAPHYMSTRGYGDPTHTRYTGDLTFHYFNKEWREGVSLDHYGINCDFDLRYSYYIDNEMTLKSEEVRQDYFKYNWNAINDTIVELTKR